MPLDLNGNEITTETVVPPPIVPPGTPAQQTDGKTVVLPTSAFARIKQDAKEAGKRAAMTEIEGRFKTAGFASMDDALKALADLKAGAAARPNNGGGNGQPGKGKQQNGNGRPNGQPAADPPPDVREERTAKDLRHTREREALQKKARIEERKRRDLQQEMDRRDAEHALRMTALSVGIKAKDVDYAVSMLHREVSGKDEAQLKGFDEIKYFGDLRAEQPYLFGETVTPATTGTGGAGTPGAPKPGAAAAGAAAGAQVDVRKMNKQEYNEHMQKRGLGSVADHG